MPRRGPKIKKSPAIPVRDQPKRSLKTPGYKSFRLSKRIAHPADKLPKSRQLFRASLSILWLHKRKFSAVLVVYALLYFVFVRGFVGSDLATLKESLDESAGVVDTQAAKGFGMIVFLFSNVSAPDTEASGIYQFILTVLVSLALIWLLRQVHAEKPARAVTAKNAYYKGTAAFVPYMLVMAVVGLQMVPALIGATVYQQVLTTGLAATSGESFVWLILLMATLLLSFYMLASSIFALYIVTLPDVTPLQALRSARQLVHLRRFEVMRKIVFLPFVLAVIGVVLFMPLVLYVTAVAEVIFVICAIISIAISHSYMYQLYRSLL